MLVKGTLFPVVAPIKYINNKYDLKLTPAMFPPVWIVFWSFHIMMYLGFYFALFGCPIIKLTPLIFIGHFFNTRRVGGGLYPNPDLENKFLNRDLALYILFTLNGL